MRKSWGKVLWKRKRGEGKHEGCLQEKGWGNEKRGDGKDEACLEEKGCGKEKGGIEMEKVCGKKREDGKGNEKGSDIQKESGQFWDWCILLDHMHTNILYHNIMGAFAGRC